VAIKTGRKYDPTSKRAYDTFRYESREQVLASTTIASGVDGTLRLEVGRAAAAGVPKGQLRGRPDRQRLRTGPGDDVRMSPAMREPADEVTGSAGAGQTSKMDVSWMPRCIPAPWGDAIPPTGAADRFLFYTGKLVARRDRHHAPEFVHRFSLADLPALREAVWFTGRTHVASDDYVARTIRGPGLVATATLQGLPGRAIR
jgi:hypothetical protein